MYNSSINILIKDSILILDDNIIPTNATYNKYINFKLFLKYKNHI